VASVCFAVFALAALGSAGEAPVDGLRYGLEPVAPGVYVAIAAGVPYYVSNSVVIVGEDDVVVVDPGAGPNEARVLLSAIRTVSDRPVRWLIDTHFHFDHALGNAAFTGAVVVAHDATRELLRPDGGSRTLANNLSTLPGRIEGLRGTGLVPVLPALTFDERLTLHAGGREIQLLHLGRGHTAGDVVVYLPRERVVCTGDLFNGYIGFMGDAYIGEWAQTLDRLAALDFDTVIAGHGAPFKGKEAIGPVQACLRDLWQQVACLKGEGVAAEVAATRIDLRRHATRFPRLAQVGFDPLAVRRMYAVMDADESARR
jgi:cyclase